MLTSKLLNITTTVTNGGQLGQALVRLMHTSSTTESLSKPTTTPIRAFQSFNQTINNGPRVLITGSFGQLGIGLAQIMR